MLTAPAHVAHAHTLPRTCARARARTHAHTSLFAGALHQGRPWHTTWPLPPSHTHITHRMPNLPPAISCAGALHEGGPGHVRPDPPAPSSPGHPHLGHSPGDQDRPVASQVSTLPHIHVVFACVCVRVCVCACVRACVCVCVRACVRGAERPLLSPPQCQHWGPSST